MRQSGSCFSSSGTVSVHSANVILVPSRNTQHATRNTASLVPKRRSYPPARFPPVRVTQQRLRLFADDLFAAGDFFLTLLEVIVGNGLQVVHVVEIYVCQEVDFRLDVAGHGDVDEQQRAV